MQPSEIIKNSMIAVFTCFTASVFSGDAQTILTPEDSFSGWKVAHRLEMKPGKEALKLYNLKWDSSIVRDVEIDPHTVNAIQITYRAKGIPAKTSGEIYFANSLGGFLDHRRWNIPSLQGDGEWHTLLLTHKNLVNPKEWTDGGTVTKLRLDMVNSAGGEIDIAKVVLLEKVPETKKKINNPPVAEIWPTVPTQYLEEKKAGTYFQGFMICSPEDIAGNRPHTFFLRKKFQIPEKITRAYIQFSGDDRAKIFLNGKYVASAPSWAHLTTMEISDFLKQGNNLLAAEYGNDASAGGFLCELFLETESGKQYRINSDRSFLSASKKEDGWNLENFNDANWKKSLEQNPPPASPWGVVLPYVDFSCPQNYLRAETNEPSALEGKKWHAEFHFKGKMPAKEIAANITLAEDGKNVVSEENISLPPSSFRKIGSDRWVLNLSYRIPQYLRAGTYVLTLRSPELYIVRGGVPKIKLSVTAAEMKRPEMFSEVKQTPQGPRWFVNGKIFHPVWGLTWSRLGNEFGSPDLNLQRIAPPGWWKGIGQYDFSAVDRQVHDILNAHPERLLMLEIGLRLPDDWAKKYPSELAAHEDGTISPYHYPPFSYASKSARQEMMKAIRQFIHYAEAAPYASRVVGYFISGGMTGEWVYWTASKGKMLDYSKPNKEAYRIFSGREIPSSARRLSGDNHQVLQDPVKRADCIRFNEYASESVADMIIEFGQTAKECLKGRKVIGTYYGYSYYLPLDTGYATHGHFSLKKVLDANVYNMLVSPISYWNRSIGDTPLDMKPFTSIQNRGVLSVIEDDTRLHNMQKITRAHNDYQAVNPEQSVSLLRRNLSLALCRNSLSYFYAIYGRRNFDFPEAAETIAAQKVIGTHCTEKGTERKAEIAVVVSEKSWLMLPQKRDVYSYNDVIDTRYKADGTPYQRKRFRQHLSGELITGLIDFARIGAPVDYLLAEDLTKTPGNYKLYVFLNAFRGDNEFVEAVRKLREKKTTLFWVYAPGYYSGRDQCGVAFMEQLTGFRFGMEEKHRPLFTDAYGFRIGNRYGVTAPTFHVLPDKDVIPKGTYPDSKQIAVAEKKTGTATDIFCAPVVFPAEYLRHLAKQAEVRFFTDSLDFSDANENLFTLHAKTKGKKTVLLPRKSDVLDVFNRKIVARNADSFTFEAPLHSSWLFYYGKDADQVLEKLKQETLKLKQ